MSHMGSLKFDPFTNVVATGLATAKFRSVGALTIDSITLDMGGTAFNASHIAGIRLIPQNGKDILAGISGSRLLDINEFMGHTDDATKLTIHLGDPTAESLIGQRMGGLDLSAYPGDVTLLVEISGATAPTLSARANVLPPKTRMGHPAAHAPLHRAFIEHIEDIAGATVNQVIRPNLPLGTLFGRLAIFGSNLDALDVKKDGQLLYEEVSVADNEYLQNHIYSRVPQTGLYVYDKVLDGNFSNYGQTVRENGQAINWQFRVTTSGATTLTSYADLIASQQAI